MGAGPPLHGHRGRAEGREVRHQRPVAGVHEDDRHEDDVGVVLRDRQRVSGRPVRYLKVYADAKGETHFADEPVERLVEWDSRFTRLVRVGAGRTSALHPEPAPTLATALAGSMVITTSDGASRRLEPGTAMLFLDTEGRGHSFANGD